MARTRIVLSVAIVAIAWAATGLPGGAGTERAPFPDALNIVPASAPRVGSCIPFANNTDFGFSGFIYRQVPAFKMHAGTPIAFDLGGTNGTDIRRDIYFSAADHDPGGPGNGNVRALNWVKVVSTSQLPSSPRGNTIVGDYDLRYVSEAPFTFGGGGFIIGFSASPPAAYPDTGCESVAVTTSSTDASNNFYGRFWSRPDRDMSVLDRGTFSTTLLAGFVIFADVTPPDVTATVTPAPRPDGWIDPGSDNVTVTFTGTDAGSGVASCDTPVVITEPGVHEITGRCVDNADNVGTTAVTVRLSRSVEIDLFGNNPVNPLNAHRKGQASFTAFSTPAFDALRIDPSSVRFGVTGTENSVRGCDVFKGDLRCRFDVVHSGIADTLVMTGYVDGIKVVGYDSLKLVGRR